MGKKSKQKKLRAKQPATATTQSRTSSPRESSALGDALFSGSPVSVTAAPVRPGSAKANTVIDYGYVRVEIKLILIYLLLVVSLLAATVIVNARTTWLGTAGTEVARVIGLRE